MRAFLFPGQGSQAVGMGVALAGASRSARDVFDEVDQALGQNLFRLMRDGPEDELKLTENAQPAIMAHSIAVFRALTKDGGVELTKAANFVAGHSLGEYSALCAAGSFDLATTAKLLKLRGQAMQAAVPVGQGAMAAILGLDLAGIEAACAEAAQGEVVSPANINSPGQVVIAGHAAAVRRASDAAIAAGAARAVPLQVSAPFHCALMAPAAKKLASALERIEIGPLAFPVIANVDARPNRDPSRVKDLLVRQVDHPVRWEETVRAMASDGVTHILELGPGKVLAGLVRRIAKEIEVLPVGTPEGVEAAAKLFA